MRGRGESAGTGDEGAPRQRDGRALRHAFTVGALVAVAAGCGDSGGGSGGAGTAVDAFCVAAMERVDAFLAGFSPQTDDRYGGTAVVASIGELPDGMNALVSQSAEGTEHQTFVNLMTLVRWGDDIQTPEPYLAESWEFDWDAGTLTFHLRDDVWWQDGVKTTAEDVAFTYRRASDPDGPFPNAAFWDFYERGEAGVEVVDSFTVRFRLDPHQEPLDPWRATAIMPAHLLADVPVDQLKGHPYGTQCPVGNGPFRFVEHRQDDRWVFAANPAFPEGLGGRPFVERYVYRVIPEPATLLASLLAGEIDLYIAVKPDQAPRVEASANAHLEVFPWRAFDFIGWNARRPQWADARVRRAITMALNREEIVGELLSGYATVVDAGVPPGFWQYDAISDLALPYDPAGARALLDEAGWMDRDGDGVRENADGVRLEGTLLYNAGNEIRRDMAEFVQARLVDVGIRIQPQVLEFGTMIERVTDSVERDFDGVVMGWVTEFRLDDRDLFHSARIDGPYAFSGTADPELDGYLELMQDIPDREAALPIWRAYTERLIEVQPYTYLFSSQRILGVGNRLLDVRGDARGNWVNIARWRLDPGAR